jgi:hypothetical protein
MAVMSVARFLTAWITFLSVSISLVPDGVFPFSFGRFRFGADIPMALLVLRYPIPHHLDLLLHWAWGGTTSWRSREEFGSSSSVFPIIPSAGGFFLSGTGGALGASSAIRHV